MQYLSLLHQVCSTLELEVSAASQRSLLGSRDEREGLLAERCAACRLVVGHVERLKERLRRKEELLLSFNADLTRTRQEVISSFQMKFFLHDYI